jgi:hypothetical protein
LEPRLTIFEEILHYHTSSYSLPHTYADDSKRLVLLTLLTPKGKAQVTDVLNCNVLGRQLWELSGSETWNLTLENSQRSSEKENLFLHSHIMSC